MAVHGGAVIRKARMRAGLAQSVLAERLGTTSSVISRWERGHVEPGFATVDEVTEACGLLLSRVLAEPDPHPGELGLLQSSLALTPSGRLQRLIDFVAFVEAARA
jgi:transcriptional regulator with XRE-family HTH domain